jgi:hypothetical protein
LSRLLSFKPGSRTCSADRDVLCRDASVKGRADDGWKTGDIS